jgi:uncharacterized membrane protein YgcG
MNHKKAMSSAITYGVLVLITIVCLFPIVWMCLISIKDISESITVSGDLSTYHAVLVKLGWYHPKKKRRHRRDDDDWFPPFIFGGGGGFGGGSGGGFSGGSFGGGSFGGGGAGSKF